MHADNGRVTSEPPAEPASSTDPFAQVASARRSYLRGELREDELAPTWLDQFRRWYDDAGASAEVGEANAMQIATVDEAGLPDVRTVLARGFDASGVVFYTNYDSAKGRQLIARPRAAAVFSWLPLERQVRLRGSVTKVTRAETESYFASRPRGAQLGAWASPQSEVIFGRAELEARLADTEERFVGRDVPAPQFWGGFRLTVTEVEFWQGREFRLHDRLRWRRAPHEAGHAGSGEGGWTIERLAP